MKNAAAEKSPGTTNRGAAFHPTDGRPSINKFAPSRRKAIPRNWNNRSVWSRERRGSVMRVVPSANKAASNNADLICALATGEAQDLHTVSLAVAQADLSFRLILELRNRLADALQEVTRMQV